MRLFRLFTAVLLAAAVLAACSDKQKEAARLEQEMKDREGAADTMAAQPAAEPDTTQQSATAANAGAIPQEQKPQAESMPPAPMGEGYTVQVASCEDQAYARYLVSLYRERGYDPYVTQYTLDGQLYYRVRVGNVPTLAEARALKNELQSKYSVPAWIDEN